MDNTSQLLTQNTVKVRYDWLDAVKAFAMALVIFCHLGLNGVGHFQTYASFIKLPLFFAASGFVFNPDKNQSFIQFLKSRFTRVIVPYICLSVLVRLTALFGYSGSFIDWLKESIFNITTGKTMWFLPTLFICNCVMFLIFRLSKKNNWVIIISALASFVIGYFLICDKHVFMGVNTAFIAYPMCVFGYYLKSNIMKLKNKLQLVICAVSLFAYLAMPIVYRLIVGKYNHINMYESYYDCYFYDMLVSYAGTLGVFILFSKLKFPKFVSWFGRNTIFYYAFHVSACRLLLFILRNLISSELTAENLTSSYLGSAIYSLITLASLLLLVPICLLVNKYIPFIVGAKKSKRN